MREAGPEAWADDGATSERRARDILDLQEGPRAGAGARRRGDRAGCSGRARRIAIVGASPDPGRPSHGVIRYLMHQGYECVPVNPNARDVLGMPGLPDDRRGGRGDRAGRHRRRLPALGAVRAPRARKRSRSAPRCLWLQLGVVNWEAARIAPDGRSRASSWIAAPRSSIAGCATRLTAPARRLRFA